MGNVIESYVETVHSRPYPNLLPPATQSFTFTEKTLDQLRRQEAKKRLGRDMKLFNFAVAGQSRTGQ